MTLPAFGFVTRHAAPLPDGLQCEAEWMAQCAATGRAVAHLWHGAPGWSVPKSYARSPRWREAQAELLDSGTPLHVRASGGGLVPLGAGLLNLSLVWRNDDATTPRATDAIYRALCDSLAAALARLGLRCGTTGVPGSWCDGRYNLAVAGRKIAGTAQAWKRIDARMVVLAHAVLITGADSEVLTAQANRIEAALGRDATYRADAVTSIARAGGDAPPTDADVQRVVAEQFARVVAPTVAAA